MESQQTNCLYGLNRPQNSGRLIVLILFSLIMGLSSQIVEFNSALIMDLALI